jgi:hypothetical protein
MFALWLKRKYADRAAFETAWGPQGLNNSILRNQKLPTDESWEENRIYPAGNPWFFDPDNLNSSQRPYATRLLDTMEFLYELQNEVYDRYVLAIREAGFSGELIASNWHAGRMMSHFYNLHSDARIGTVDRHNYFGGGDTGIGLILSASMLALPGSGTLSSSLQQVEGLPFMLSEWIHVFPNEWGAEGPALIGAYGMGLQGWDVSFPFQNRDDGNFSSAIGAERWDATAPHFLGIFPAVSRQVLRGDVREAEMVHLRRVHMPSLARQEVGFDERTTQEWDVKTFTSDVFPAEALAAARGLVRFSAEPEKTEAFDLTPHRERDGIRSATGELFWRAGRHVRDGHIEINTPATQAVVGFAEGRSVDLADVLLRPRSRFGAVYLSAQSREGRLSQDAILLTAIARARNQGQIVIEDSLLLSRGEIRNHRPTGPVVMEPVRVEIQLKRKGDPVVHLLDHAGVKTGKTLPAPGGKFEIDTGRDATPYYLIEYPL